MGSEAVVESGGLVNAVGSNQIAIIAKAANKPFYALAERSLSPSPSFIGGLIFPFFFSYKFHRMFPLSQYDLPTHNSRLLSFPQTLSGNSRIPPSGRRPSESSLTSNHPGSIKITQEDIARNNPDVDYTRYSLSFFRCLAG